MATYANQKIIKVKKKKYVNDFLQIGNNEWMTAAQDLTRNTFLLYLYLASNNNGFIFALSQKTVQDALGMSKASYHRAVDELSEKGYLYCEHGNTYTFVTIPNPDWICDL